ncbi:MFS general substrate transporter [Aspergillus cavernicola]|uniref:MFS general substrate transporter n=1 Tax=Aspergillus cavernicola TaxID=176166 RepID=A0ABR4I6R2_9EURO
MAEKDIIPTAQDVGADPTKTLKADEGYDIFIASQSQQFTEEESKRIARKLDWHLLPCMCMFYGLNYVDKVIMGWAVLFTFKEDLGLVGNQYSWASSVFYFGYLAAQYPANFLLQRFSTSKVLALGTLTWGVIIVLHMACFNYAGLIALRFFLGVAESVASPGFVLYTSHWYTRQEQVMRTMTWAAMQGVFNILGSLLSYGLGHIDHTSIPSWKYIFLVLGALSILTGIVWLIIMPEAPHNAKFLTEEERAIAVQRVAANMMGIKSYEWKYYQIWHCIKDPKTWFLVSFVFFSMLPNGGLTNFGSLVVSGLGFGKFETLLVGLPSSIVSAGSMIIWASFSTRYEGLRTWGMIGPLIPAIAGISAVYGTSNIPSANKWGRLVAYWLINSYAVTWPFTLTIIGQNIAGHTKRAATNVLLFVAFSAGNIAGPFFFRDQDAPGYVLAITIILICFCLCIFISAGLRVYMIVANKRRDRKYGIVERREGEVPDGVTLGMHDLTELENPDFRYVL